MTPFRFDGKAALVTGAGRGIGAAVATRLAEAGAQVLLANRSLDVAQELAAQLVARGLAAQATPFDATEVGCRDAVEATLRAFGRLDVLVH
ncbi:MAG: SDR family NAD(P)-dependent oxidoreductase, partial [Comamonadaceae bacterium]